MKIGIYSEPSGGAVGGSEYCVAALAEALRQSHHVEIVSHRKDLTLGELSRVFGTELDDVTLRHVPIDWPAYVGPPNVWGRFQVAASWRAGLSEPYDLFVNFTHGLPPFCHARRGVLVILFPWFDRRSEGPTRLDDARLRGRLRRLYSDWEWERRFATYQTKLAISRFTRRYAREWWNVECDILHPPTNIDFEVSEKANLILSVGRFATQGHPKKQREMVTAFGQMQPRLPGWEYCCVGGLGTFPDDVAYFESVRNHAAGTGAQVRANLERSELRRLFERSKIFWHAAGYQEDETLHPQLSEHFGIVTVEAMAAGCVPVVVDKGGQSEIVEHGVSGFLWDTLDELTGYTSQLAADDCLRRRMSVAARERASLYGKNVYTDRFSRIVGPLLEPAEPVGARLA